MKLLICLLVLFQTSSGLRTNLPNQRALTLLRNCSNIHGEIYAPRCVEGRTHYEPRAGVCDSINVEVRLLPERFLNIDDLAESFSIAGSVKFYWYISCPSYHQNVDDYSFNIKESYGIWKPTIHHENGVSNPAMKGSSFATRWVVSYVMRSNEIKFLWQQFGIFISACDMDYSMFPFDNQHCHVDFASRENIRAVEFNASFNRRGLPWNFMPSNDGWTLLDIVPTTGAMDIDGNRAIARFSMHFRRRPDFYIYSLMLPCFALVGLILAAFIMLPAMAERPMFTVTILLALTFLQSSIRDRVPPKPQRIFLNNYTDSSVLLSWFCTVYMLVTTMIARVNPKWYKEGFTACSKSRARFIDIIAFAIALVCFCAINFYAIYVAIDALYHRT